MMLGPVLLVELLGTNIGGQLGLGESSVTWPDHVAEDASRQVVHARAT